MPESRVRVSSEVSNSEQVLNTTGPRLLESCSLSTGEKAQYAEGRSSLELESLHLIGNHMALDDTLDETLSSALNSINALVNCDSCFTYVLLGEQFEPWVWKSGQRLDQSELELDSSVRGFLTKHRTPVAISYDASERVQFRFFGDWSRNPGETFISLPLVSRAKLVGVMNFHHAPRVYDKQEVKFLSTLGAMVGAEIGISRLETDKSRLYEQLETRKLVERGKGILQT